MPTDYIRSDNRDGHILSSVSSDYVTTHDAAIGAISHVADIFVGQQYPFATTQYLVVRLVLFFDTSVIPAGATILSATLTFKASTNFSTTDFYIELVDGNDCSDPLVTGDYHVLLSKTTVGGNNVYSNPWVAGTAKTITLDDTGLSWINPGGLTKLALRSLEDINVSAPTTAERVAIYSGSQVAEEDRPLLTVEWVAGGMKGLSPASMVAIMEV